MPVPCGVSVGAFVAGIELIHSVGEALDSSGGSKAQYQGVIRVSKSFFNTPVRYKSRWRRFNSRSFESVA